MTTRPELVEDVNILPGLAAIALFVVIAISLVTTDYAVAQGFGEAPPITASIGYALFNLEGTAATIQGEGFLVPFIVVAFVLDAALGVAVMLAKREGGGV